MSLPFQKDSSFNKSFERENGFSFTLFGQNKLYQEPSLNRPSSIFKNGSFSMPFVPCVSRQDGKQPVNLFVELADEVNDKNDDFINLNIMQKCSSSIKPMMSVNKSVNERGRGFYNLRLSKDREGNESIAQDEHGFYPELYTNDQKKLGLVSSSSCNELANPIANILTKHPSLNKISSELVCSPKPIRIIKEDSLFRTRSKQVPSGPSLLKRESSVKQVPAKASEKSKFKEEKKTSKPNKACNYNDEVERMLEEGDDNIVQPPELKLKKQRSSKCSIPQNVNIRRHRKKSKKQIEILESHFNMDEDWPLELVEQLANDLNLEKDQVYKWNWDKRKRLRKKAEKEGDQLIQKKGRHKRTKNN